MKNTTINNEKEYERSLARINELFNAQPDTPEYDEMELLVALVEAYEARHYVIFPPDPVDAIKFRMEQMGLRSKDLIPLIGNKSKVSEVLSGKRSLSLNMIRRLNERLGIPAEILIRGRAQTPLCSHEEKSREKDSIQKQYIPSAGCK